MFDDNAKRESSWATILRIAIIVMVLSSGFLFYYIGPSVDDLQGNIPQASASSTVIPLVVGNIQFFIPENYTQFPRARRGGERNNVALYAHMPKMSPFAMSMKDVFEGNAPDSPIIHFQIESYRQPLNEEGRFERIYMHEVMDTNGETGPAGLTMFHFGDDTGYRNEDLMLGRDQEDRIVIFRCARLVPGIPSPNCRRDMQLSQTVGLSYRFKRAHVAHWRRIDRDVQELTMSFIQKNSDQ